VSTTLPTAPPPPERIRERLRLFLVMLLGLVILVQLDLPFRLAGYALAVPLLWIEVRLLVALRRARRAGEGARGQVTVAIGLGLTGVILLSLVADSIYYPLSSDLETCLSQANTLTARDACHAEQKRRIEDVNDRLRRRAGLP
jgi:hypothetical protein